MDLDDDDKAAGEILRSLLSTPKMQTTQCNDGSNWQDLEADYHSQDQIIWQIESPRPEKDCISGNENFIQHIPVTYLTTDNRNSTFAHTRTLVKPVTYVLSRNMVPETATDGSNSKLVLKEPQKIVFVQDSRSPENGTEAKVFSIAPEVQTHYMAETGMLVSLNGEFMQDGSGDVKAQKTGKCDSSKKDQSDLFDEILVKSKNGEESVATKTKMEKRISGNKKPKKKRKNSKPKSKLKSGVKGLGKKPPKSLKSVDHEKSDTEGEKEKRNLFELTRLEDNVDQVAERFKVGCECSDSNCFDGLNPDNVFKHRLNIADLTKAEHDMYLMGVIMASIQNLEETCRHKERIRIRSCYAYQGKKVCLTAFLYLQHVTLYQMKRLRSHLKNHGVSPRIHGNRGRKPANTFSLDIYRRATNFVQSYIEKHCVKTVPNFTTFSSNKIGSNSISGETKSGKKPNKVKIPNKMTSYHLPPECTKKIVHREYKSFCESLKPSQKVMKYSTFTSFLKKQFPNVKFQKVDKKPEEKASHERGKEERPCGGEASADKGIQTVVYLPAKNVQVAEPGAFVVASKSVAPAPKGSQIVNLQFCTGNELQLPGQVLVGNQIYSAQCVAQATANGQLYAVDNIV